MKYLLLEHADGNDPKQLRIFDTVAARARATREAILGSTAHKDESCPELTTLATEGIIHFEGDPSLEWIDAEISFTRLELENQIKAIADDCALTMPLWLAGMLQSECRRQGLKHVQYDADDFRVTVKIKQSPKKR